jgi:dipeptidyl-peptidase-4
VSVHEKQALVSHAATVRSLYGRPVIEDPAAPVPAVTPVADFPRRQARTHRFTLGAPRLFQVSPDGARVVFVRTDGPTDRVGQLLVLDVEDGGGTASTASTERVVLDPTSLGAVGDDGFLAPEERARRERLRESGSGVTAFDTDVAVQRAVSSLGGALVVADLVGGTGPRALSAVTLAIDPRMAPDGSAVAYHSAGSVWVTPLGEGEPRRLAEPDRSADEQAVTWGLSDFAAAEELGRSHSIWWSPSSDGVLATRVDEAAVTVRTVHDPAHPESTPQSLRYPMAGEANAETTLWWLPLDGPPELVELDHERWPYLASVSWRAGDDPALITLLDRPQRELAILAWRPGEPARVVRVQRSSTFLDLVPGSPRWRHGRLLTVEADDDPAVDTHRLMVDGTPMSPAGLQVRSIVGTVDAGVLVIAARDPLDRQACLVGDDGGVTELTGPGSVGAAAVGGATVVLCVESLAAPAPSWTVQRLGDAATGRPLQSTAAEPGFDVRLSLLDQQEATEPRVAVLLPSWWTDGAPSLPVLLDPYGGPHGQQVWHAARPYAESQWWAEQGFVVVVADGPGTPGSPTWERAMAGDMAGPALRAQLRALDMLAASDVAPAADLTRVGIRGWSFGGYLAALAVLQAPDRVHAAVSGAPVTDWRWYDTTYTERYLGLPQEHPDRYDAGGLVSVADALQRPLLLVHGLADDNVLATHTLRLSQALLTAGRPHQVLPLTGITHMAADEVVAEQLLLVQLRFLRDALGVVTRSVS